MVSFPTTIVAAVAAFAMVEPSQAGFISKILGGGKRSVAFSARDAGALWTRASTLEQSFNTCMDAAREILVVTKVGQASFKLAAEDGSFPEPCVVVAKSYISTAQTDGQLFDNKDGTYTLHPNAQDVAGLAAMVKSN